MWCFPLFLLWRIWRISFPGYVLFSHILSPPRAYHGWFLNHHFKSRCCQTYSKYLVIQKQSIKLAFIIVQKIPLLRMSRDDAYFGYKMQKSKLWTKECCLLHDISFYQICSVIHCTIDPVDNNGNSMKQYSSTVINNSQLSILMFSFSSFPMSFRVHSAMGNDADNTQPCGGFHSVILKNIFMWNTFILEKHFFLFSFGPPLLHYKLVRNSLAKRI